MKPKESKILPRITFEEVLQNQLELRDRIEKLISENRVPRIEEQRNFSEIYRRATLGFGASKIVNIYTTGGSSEGIHQISLDRLALAFLSKFGEKVKEKPVDDFASLWTIVLDGLIQDVLGLALGEAVRLSPERDKGIVRAGVRPEGEE